MQKESTGAKEKARQKVRKRLLNNLGLKLVSVFMAVAIWFTVVMISNPKDSVTFNNISVNLVNTELLEGEDKLYEVLENTDRVRVTVEAPRKVINQLRSSDIIAEADVSRLTEVNTIAINCSVLNNAVEISSITSNPDVVRLKVEEKATKWVNVKLNTVGEVAEGHIVYSVSSDQTRMEISGPESVVSEIDHAGLEMDVTGATENVSGNVEIRFYDIEGNLVDNTTDIVKNADNMHMEVKVLATKEVPIEVLATGTPAEGYLITGRVECSPSTVVLAGTTSALADISKITATIDITGESEDEERIINLRSYLDNSIYFADRNFNGRVNAVAHIEPSVERTLAIPGRNIFVQNLPEGFELEFAEGQQTYRLRISGLNAAVSAVEQGAVQGTLDIGAWMRAQNMSELSAGTYEIPLEFNVPGDVKIENEVSARVTIAEADEEDEE